jgi:phage tail sheath protein FI
MLNYVTMNKLTLLLLVVLFLSYLSYVFKAKKRVPAQGVKNRTAPEAYVTESGAFPPSIVGAQTAVPAFIGYTEKAEIDGQPCFNKPIRVGSMADFETYFGGRYNLVYDIHEQTNPQDGNYDFKVKYAASTSLAVSPPEMGSYLYYYLEQTDASKFYLYDSMRLFYANGGGNCYVVSVGDYARGASIQKDDLIGGLNVIRDQVGPTMLVVPDALLLDGQSNGGGAPDYPATFKPSAAFQTVVREMLKQCGDLEDRVAILDVYGTLAVNNATLDAVITQFRTDVGNENLKYGMAYFPFLHTSAVEASDFTYRNLQPLSLLQNILSWENHNLYHADNQPKYTAVQNSIDSMASPSQTTDGVQTLTRELANAIPLLKDILGVVVEKNCVLPPSGALAGVYTYTDATRGVWNAPADIDLNSVEQTTFKMSDTQQGDLNMPVDGKAVNALREFVGRGTVVWGARTLDGNSNDYRYIQVCRTLIYIEQSIKAALATFVFAPNDGNTWVTVTSMVSNFLENLWAQGGLMGAKASDAFTVQCGLGSTMTGMDVVNGYMIVQVTLQMIHPAEFIELTFKQKMEGAG